MATELFSFKLLIHGYSLDPTFYQRIGSFINIPGFAVQLFDYPTFILYSRERLYDDQIGHDKWIRFGNGKSTAFEMSEEQMNGFVNDRPLIINFIDAENKQVRVFSKVIVTLQAFKNDLLNYLDKTQENWKRKVFMMYDEAKNEVGRIDLSLSLAKKRKEILEKAIESEMDAKYQSAPIKAQPGTTYIRTISEAPNRVHQQQNELALKSRSRTDGFTSEYKSYDEIEPATYETRSGNEKGVTFKIQSQENKEPFAVGPPTLKTIVEGHYCPPVMVYQKRKKLVRFANDEEPVQGERGYPMQIERTNSVYVDSQNRPISSPNKGFRSTEQQKFSSGSNAFRRGTSSVSFAENAQEQQARPVVVLSNKESEKLVDLYSLKNSNQEGAGLLDLLIRELVNLKAAGGQSVPDNYARSESLQIGSLRKDVPKDMKQSAPVRRASIDRDTPTNNKENQDGNRFSRSPTRNKTDGLKGMRKSLDVSNHVIKETYEEANQPDEEYSQIFESISASQSLPRPLGGRKAEPIISGRQKNGNVVERMESIGESYPEDFDQLSAASASQKLSRHPSKGHNYRDIDESRDVSEDIVESGSRIYGHSGSLTKNLKKDYGIRESIRSEYSEDFEALSEDNY